MTFKESVNTVFNKYAVFSGRASRSEYWYFALFQFIVGILFSILGTIFTNSQGQPSVWISILSGLWCLLTILPSLAVSVRRLHDSGRGGGWIFINFVPVIGSIWYFVLMLLPSEPQVNRFGPMAY